MTDKIKMASELISAAKQILAADYVYDPGHRNKPRGGNWHKTDKGWSNIEKTKTAPISFDEKKGNSKVFKKRLDRVLDRMGEDNDFDFDKISDTPALSKAVQGLDTDDLNDFIDRVTQVDEILPQSLQLDIVKNKNISREQLEQFAMNDDEVVRREALNSPACDDSLRKQVAKVFGKSTKKKIFTERDKRRARETTSEKDMDDLISQYPFEGAHAVSENPNATEKILSKLSRNSFSLTRANAARNPNMSVEDLVRLADDEDTEVKAGVAANPRTPQDVLRKLSTYKENDDYWGESVGDNLAGNPSTPVDILKGYAKKGQYLSSLAENSSTPENILRGIAKQGDWECYVGLSTNKKAPEDVLRKIVDESQDLEFRDKYGRKCLGNIVNNTDNPMDLRVDAVKSLYKMSAWVPPNGYEHDSAWKRLLKKPIDIYSEA